MGKSYKEKKDCSGAKLEHRLKALSAGCSHHKWLEEDCRWCKIVESEELMKEEQDRQNDFGGAD